MTDTDKETKSDPVEEIAALRRFKAYVHQRLDEAGIPTHPDGPHSAEGCRVGDRLDIALGKAAGLVMVPEDRVIEFMKFALERAALFAREVSPEAAGRVDGLSAVAAYLDAKRAFAASLTEKDKT